MNKTFTSRVSSARHAGGFTLIELMVACAIVGILTAIAYPSYRNYVIRGQLVDATNGLSGMRANMERYYQDNRTYTGTYSPCNTASPSGKFNLSCSTATASAFTLLASGTGPLVAFSYTVDQTNLQTTTVNTSTAPRGGWATCSSAWVIKPGGC